MKTQEQLMKSNAKTLHDGLEAFYLDWVNSFLSFERLAEHYGITEQQARLLISIGKQGNLREQGYY